ncbi:MAG: hypothetical protein CMJ47_09115 [Planctomyces sp.]|nr:hypothetical protein [Planctomyces sp.]
MKSSTLAGRKVTLTIVSLLGLALLLTGDQLLANTNVPAPNQTETVDTWFSSGLLVVALIALAAGFVHSGIGFGFGIVAIALMPLVIDARQTHLLVSLAAVPVQLGTVWAYRKGVVWKPLLFALVGATIGLPAGLWLFQTINLDWLTRGTGIAILFMIGYTFVVRSQASRRSSAQSAPPADRIAEGDTQDLPSSKRNSGEAAGASAIGVASGFLMGAVTMPGPPVVAYALQRDWSQDEFKSFVNQFLLALSLFKVAGLFVTAGVSQQSLFESLFVFPAALIGIAIGKRFSQHLSTGGFRTIVAVVLSLVAILLIVKGGG